MQESTSYQFDVQFERQLVTVLCKDPKTFGRIGTELNAQLLDDADAQLGLIGANLVFQETDRGPSSHAIVLQRLCRQKFEGKLRASQIDKLHDMFEDCEAKGLPDPDDLVDQVVPILKRIMHDEVVRISIAQVNKEDADMSSVVDTITKAEDLGKVDKSIGSEFNETIYREIAQLSSIPRLKTGIEDLDIALEGGFESGTMSYFLGSTGDGKSMALVQCAAQAIIQGIGVLYVTLEISQARTMLRLMANLTNMSMNSILNGRIDTAKERMTHVLQEGGGFRCEYMVPGVTQLHHIRDLAKRAEDADQKKYNLIVIDYADRVGYDTRKHRNDYTGMLEVYEGFRTWVESEDRWGLTASQARRRESKNTKRKKLDTDDGSDSQNKARVTDGLITLNVSEDGQEITFFIGKSRAGGARKTIGPMQTRWSFGQIVNVNRQWGRRNKTEDEFAETDRQNRLELD